MKPDEAIKALQEHIDKSDLDRVYDERILNAFDEAIEALKTQEAVEVLADRLNGCPLTDPCDKLFTPHDNGWCANHCKSDVPDKECWLKYAYAVAKEQSKNEC